MEMELAEKASFLRDEIKMNVHMFHVIERELKSRSVRINEITIPYSVETGSSYTLAKTTLKKLSVEATQNAVKLEKELKAL